MVCFAFSSKSQIISNHFSWKILLELSVLSIKLLTLPSNSHMSNRNGKPAACQNNKTSGNHNRPICTWVITYMSGTFLNNACLNQYISCLTIKRIIDPIIMVNRVKAEIGSPVIWVQAPAEPSPQGWWPQPFLIPRFKCWTS